MSVWLSSVGLGFDIIGAVLLYRYTLPALLAKHGMNWAAIEGVTEENKARWKRQRRLSKLAIVMLIIGFGLQLASNHVPHPDPTPASYWVRAERIVIAETGPRSLTRTEHILSII